MKPKDNRCNLCLRPLATKEDWVNYEEGEGEHLCWSPGFPGACDDVRNEFLSFLEKKIPLRFAKYLETFLDLSY